MKRSRLAIVIVAVLCLVLIQPPREVTTQLTSARMTAVTDVIFRWLLLLAVLPITWCFYEWRKHTRHFGLIAKALGRCVVNDEVVSEAHMMFGLIET